MKKMTMIIGQAILLVVSLIVVTAVADYFFNGRIAKIIVFAFAAILFVALGNHNNRQRTKHLIEMWAYADKLGYGPAELKQRVPQYGIFDWEASRPEKLKFYPSDKVVDELVQQFKVELSSK
ncbi:hypothetical protein [Lacticaseibacillus sp. GG6-2]